MIDWPGQPGAPATRPLAVEAADEAWAPQPIIGLPGDPVTLPNESQLRALHDDGTEADYLFGR